MANAVMKSECDETSMTLEVHNAFEAAISRAMECGMPQTSVFDYVSKEDWKNAKDSEENILVFDPE